MSRDADEMSSNAASLDFMLNTVAAPHDLDPFFALLKRDGTTALVGAPAIPHPSPIGAYQLYDHSAAGGVGDPQITVDEEIAEAAFTILAFRHLDI